MVAKVLKILCVLFASATVMLCGCHRDNAAKGLIETDFSADFTADYNGLSVTGRVVNTRQGVSSVEFDSPETLSGLSVRYKNGGVALIHGDVTATADEAYLPENSLPSALRLAFRSAQGGDYTQKSDGIYQINGITLTTDDNHLPKMMECAEWRVKFSNVKKLGD